jgi:xylulokinase
VRVVAGVDSSTQSTTVLLRDADNGRIISVGRSAHPATHPPTSEQAPDDWWAAFTTALAAARKAGNVEPDDIVAISIAAQCHGLVVLDAAGGIIRPAKLWNDTTSALQATALAARFGRDVLIRRLGSLPTAAFTITKLAWLASNEPENFARMAYALLPHDWLTYRLCGRRVTDRSDASGTGYFDAVENSYITEFLRSIDPDRDWISQLPEVLAPDEAAGPIIPAVAAELGVARDAVIAAGSGDQHAGAIGLGARPGDMVWVLGTSGVVYGLSESPVADPSGVVNCVADAAGGFQPLICTLNSTKVTDAIGRVLGAGHDELSDLALAAPRSPERPVFATYLDGERTPDLPAARGVISGIHSSLSREHVALAAFEGVVNGLLRGQDALLALGVPSSGRLIAIGGGANSPAYLQTIADFNRRDVHITAAVEAVAAGAAVQAATVLHGVKIQTIRDSWAPEFTIASHPRPERTDEIVRRYERTADFAARLGTTA